MIRERTLRFPDQGSLMCPQRTLDKTILTAWIGTLVSFMGWHPNVCSVVNDNESNEAESHIKSDNCTDRDELLRYAICL
jgi:hypothetical protein